MTVHPYRIELGSLLPVLLCACSIGCVERGGGPPPVDPPADPHAQAAAQTTTPEPVVKPPAQDAELEAKFPLHGLVSGLQIKIHERPDPEAPHIGWLRSGSRIRLAADAVKTNNCATGFHAIAPRGFACAGKGIAVGPTPPDSPPLNPPPRDAGLPYNYYFVKESRVPEYHRLPTRADQRRSAEFLARYFALHEKKPKRAARFYAGELKNEPLRPRVVRRFLERGFFVAGAGIEQRDQRRFVRTVRGSYVQLAQLQARRGTSFAGVELGGEQTLPVAWAVRTAQPFDVTERDDESVRMMPAEGIEPYPRLSRVPWERHERVGKRTLHKLTDGRYLKYWFVAVAEAIARPKGVAAGQPWVHVNLERQTLVAYAGDTPVYATLVSTGLPGHETPTGLFDVRIKQVASSMSDIGPELGDDDRYSIEDVPWTQYFDGSIALHGAFWHERFGLPRSHGCVNMAPLDARRVFELTWPEIPDGWHGASTDRTGLRASKIYVTEK